MKVMLIHDTHEKWGGAEDYFFNLKEKLKRNKIIVKSLGFSNKLQNLDDSIVIPLSKNKYYRALNKVVFNPWVFSTIKKNIDDFKPDIINIFNTNNYTYSLYHALKGYKVIQTVLDYRFICPVFECNREENLNICEGLKCTNKHLIKNIFKKHIIFFLQKQQIKLAKKFVNEYTTPSPHLKYCLEINNFKPVTLIPLFLRFKNCENNFKNIKWNNVLFVGQLEVNKGIWQLFKTIKNIIKKKSNIILKVAGIGSQENDLKNYIIKNNLDKNIIMLGFVDNLEKLYQECSLVIVPSTVQESFGLVTAEAMYNSRAVIGSNRGATPWLIKDNETGYIFNPDDDDLIYKIFDLIENKDKLKNFGKMGKKRIDKIISPNDIFNSTIDLYEKVLNPNY